VALRYARPDAHLLERVHDVRVVRPSQIQDRPARARARGAGELGDWFLEYCFAIPANRIGSAVYAPAELKTIQEVITLVVFAVFTTVYFNEPLSLTQGAGFALIALGAMLVFRGQL
jgi:hypothetical protein